MDLREPADPALRSLPVLPTEDDTERVERALNEARVSLAEAREYIRCEAPHEPTLREMTRVLSVVLDVLAALSPSPDRLAEVREQTLREAEQAVRAERDGWRPGEAWQAADASLRAIAALSSGTPTTEERA